MTTDERLKRIRALWQGDALHDTTLIWRSIRRQTRNPVQVVELIAGAGIADGCLEVDPDTLSAMREIAFSEPRNG